MNRMNKRQKFIASCGNPYYDKFATREEVKEARLLARGRYWLEYLQFNCPESEEDFITFCAYSPTGKRSFFDFGMRHPCSQTQLASWKKEAGRCARLWCKGKYKEAEKLDYMRCQKQNWL